MACILPARPNGTILIASSGGEAQDVLFLQRQHRFGLKRALLTSATRGLDWLYREKAVQNPFTTSRPQDCG